MPEPVVPKGVPLTRLQWKYTRQCTHTHVSGRRCASRVPKHRPTKANKGQPIVTTCMAHPDDQCSECKGMLEAFKPPNGW